MDQVPEINPAGREALSIGPAVLLVNTRARRGDRSFRAVRRALEANGFRLAAALALRDPELVPGAARASAEQGAGLLMVGGGDGTVSAVVNALGPPDAGQARPILGVLPLGTGNDFARGLGIPLNVPDACAALARGRVGRVDVGRVGARAFVNVASIGITVAITRRMTPQLKRRLGPLAYSVAAAGEALNNRAFRATLESGGARFDIDALEVVVGNGRYHGAGCVIAPQAGLRTRRLDAYAVISGASVPGALPLQTALRNALILAGIGRVLHRGGHIHDPHVIPLRGEAISVRTDPPLPIDIDGEIDGETPARFECVPDALRVLLPEPGPERE